MRRVPTAILPPLARSTLTLCAGLTTLPRLFTVPPAAAAMDRFLSQLTPLIALATSAILAPGCAALGRYSPTAGLENRGIFQPAKYPAGEWSQTAVLVQDANFTAQDGTKLHGWFVAHEQPKGHALLLHGNAGNVTLLAETLRTLNRRHNLAVLALAYRGFGKSGGETD